MSASMTARGRALRDAARPGVVQMLLGLVAVPLVVLGALITVDLREADEERAAVRDIVPVTATRLDAIGLRAALSDERTWSIAAIGIERYGVDPDVVEEIIGVDIVKRYADARLRTDDLTDDFPFAAQTVLELRTNRVSNKQISEGYDQLMQQVETAGVEAAQRLQQLAMSRADGEELLQALSTTEAAADAQLAVNGQFVSSVAARFVESTGFPERDLQRLVEERRAYSLANERIDRTIGGPLTERLTSIRSSTAESTLLSEVDAQIFLALNAGVEPADGDLFAVAIDDIDRLQTFLIAAEASSANWIDLTQASGGDLIEIARGLEAKSEQAISSSRILLITTGLAAVLGTTLVIVLLSRSLRRLALAAQMLRDGNTDVVIPAGPREVFVAGEALSEATSNFDLLRRQATVLAEGDLQHPDLERVVPGQLGESLKQVVDTLSQSIQSREAAQAEVVWEASHDGLTGLRNRSSTIAHLGRLLNDREAGQTAVLAVDLDGFKAINDNHGHPGGDEVLSAVAHRLRSACRTPDEIGRLGGDEFVMILDGALSRDATLDIATRALEAIGATITLADGAQVTVGASIGVAISASGSTVSELLKHADLAVYEAKATGRNHVVFCTEDLIDADDEERQLTSEMIHAIDNGEFVLEYQPIVDHDGEIIAAEALIRWDHPTRGLLMPSRFIQVAERSDLIVAIDRWAIAAATEQLAIWKDRVDLSVSVNVSTRHVCADSFVADVLDPLSLHNVNPSRLGIEITETALFDDPGDARQALETLRAVGIQIAVDDFGTGYSGIAQLRQLPVDIIKIDRSFTAQITDKTSNDAALVSLIMDTAHLLGATVIIEGIESVAQSDAATAMGVDSLQGWLYSPSVSADVLGQMLTDAQFSQRRSGAVT